MDNIMKQEKILAGIGCDAKDCKYNMEGCMCCAPSIDIVGIKAQTTADTACDTFEKQV